jgi:hypothetical protein
MNKKNFIRIINEEIKNFDFLSNDEFNKEQETIDLLQNEELQKQFICDSLLNKRDKIKILKITESQISGNWDESDSEDADKLSLEYGLNIEYLYDSTKKPLIFNLSFHGLNIHISVNGWYDAGNWGGTMADAIEPSGESWFDDFDWSGIDVILYLMNNDDNVQFKAFKDAPSKIQILFIREYLQNFIENQTLELRTSEMKDNIRNIPYC